MFEQWKGFQGECWKSRIDVRDFILCNVTPYLGDEAFLTGSSERTKQLLSKLHELTKLESERGGVLDVNTDTVSSLTHYPPGYLDKENELIVGLQTDAPLKRGINPFGGIRMVRSSCEAYG